MILLLERKVKPFLKYLRAAVWAIFSAKLVLNLEIRNDVVFRLIFKKNLRGLDQVKNYIVFSQISLHKIFGINLQN